MTGKRMSPAENKETKMGTKKIAIEVALDRTQDTAKRARLLRMLNRIVDYERGRTNKMPTASEIQAVIH